MNEPVMMGCSTSTARFTVEVDLRYICIQSRTNLVWLNSAEDSGMEPRQCQQWGLRARLPYLALFGLVLDAIGA